MGVHGVRHGAYKTDPQAYFGRDDRRAGCLAHGRADATPAAAPTDTPAASTDAPAAETADKNGKGEKPGGKGEDRHRRNSRRAGRRAEKPKGDAPEKAEKAAPPWGESSCSRFCRCF